MKEFENIKIKKQNNKRNNTTFKLIPKVSVKILNLRFGLFAISNCEQVKKDKRAVRSY